MGSGMSDLTSNVATKVVDRVPRPGGERQLEEAPRLTLLFKKWLYPAPQA